MQYSSPHGTLWYSLAAMGQVDFVDNKRHIFFFKSVINLIPHLDANGGFAKDRIEREKVYASLN
jgi:hypothetical protein